MLGGRGALASHVTHVGHTLSRQLDNVVTREASTWSEVGGRCGLDDGAGGEFPDRRQEAGTSLPPTAPTGLRALGEGRQGTATDPCPASQAGQG